MSLHKYKKGFTLVELLVAIVIFVAMTALLIIKYGNFGDRINLTNTAYDIALVLRQAQQYGINVSGGANENYSGGFGVYFDDVANHFFLYQEVPVNSSDSTTAYNSSRDKILNTYRLKNGITFDRLCRGTQTDCVTTALMSISFKRPNPTPLLSGTNSYAEIRIIGKGSATATVVVRNTGQIYIKE